MRTPLARAETHLRLLASTLANLPASTLITRQNLWTFLVILTTYHLIFSLRKSSTTKSLMTTLITTIITIDPRPPMKSRRWWTNDSTNVPILTTTSGKSSGTSPSTSASTSLSTSRLWSSRASPGTKLIFPPISPLQPKVLEVMKVTVGRITWRWYWKESRRMEGCLEDYTFKLF